ncbi:hypothetical protein GDO86_018551 [Hymenochirus boettgeri]|uniref:Spermatogenesis-associated protein 2 PUB-like domain-containing protein n=1 Tax=Hymenochirus boettgeri TaxID=247094 RepID=A0A8T2IG71_9PIPI|nr:hypothetical protein GDO86_018551 [Hymenochirus boettgeri]
MNRETLVSQYQDWIVTSCEGGIIAPCKKTDILMDQLLQEPKLHGTIQSDAFSLITSGLREKRDLLSALQHLADAFSLLEQASLHLYLMPWRKEFCTINTYSGLYVHVLEAAFPKDAIIRVLRKLGYELEENGQSFSMPVQPPAENLPLVALGFLAGRLECCILSDILSSAGPAMVSGMDLIQERRSSHGLMACVERLQKLSTSPISCSGANHSNSVKVCKRSEGVLIQHTQFLNQCPEPVDKLVRIHCKEKDDCEPRNALVAVDTKMCASGTKIEINLHECVFLDLSLEFRCSECHMQHSSKCPIIVVCREKGHTIFHLTLSEKHAVLKEEEKKRYISHSCLQPGNLPHYRCPLCRQLHYINCERVAHCRAQGHKASMIMLEKDQRLWLKRSEINLTMLCLDQYTKP